MREGPSNGNWKGGISLLKKADDVFSLSITARTEIKRRIKAKVVIDETTGCWNWTGVIFGGYGWLFLGRKGFKACRLGFSLFRGPVGDQWILHECDNRLCVNPKHLFLGDHKANMADMVKKGRAAKGEANGGAKLKEREVKLMRILYKKGGWTHRQLGERFGIRVWMVGQILRRKKWTHI